MMRSVRQFHSRSMIRNYLSETEAYVQNLKYFLRYAFLILFALVLLTACGGNPERKPSMRVSAPAVAKAPRRL